MSMAVAISDNHPGKDGRARFFKKLAEKINCPEVEEWLDVKAVKVGA